MGAYAGPANAWSNFTNQNRIDASTKVVVQSGLVLNLDAGASSSYPGSGTTWTDLSGSGNNGTLVNGVGYNSGNLGSLSFDGSNDYATIEANSSFQLGNGYTLCAWVKASNNPGNYAGICGTFDIIPSSYFGQNFAILPGSQRFSFVVSGWSGGSLQYIDATTQYTIGRWYYLVGTNLGVNCNFYIDGNLDTTYTQAAVASNPGPTTKFKIGRYYQNTNNFYFPGNIADIKYYNRALTATEISQNFNVLRSRFGI